MSNLDSELAFRNKLIAKLNLPSAISKLPSNTIEETDNILKSCNGISTNIIENKTTYTEYENNVSDSTALCENVLSNADINSTIITKNLEDNHIKLSSNNEVNYMPIESNTTSDIEIVEHVEPTVPPIVLDSSSDEKSSSMNTETNIDVAMNKG